ncbi:hypothetical protein N7495_008235 [Penicillium taxi]|uniref:uncharacterized protein n=1 Tax=Penicillium taxi TaxID=168475 RepID=UPI0025450065|nr:uncharacterized protein N7495_008235 [Penicillium taxi]KAJ5888194.1 hypothetical protein N7495_008235 [Penicillium taxi]
MFWLCPDGLCDCHEQIHSKTPESIGLVLLDKVSGETIDLCGENTILEVTFDIVTTNMVLKQKTHDPRLWPSTQHQITFCLNPNNSEFVNLEGLEDNSLLLTIKLKSPISPKTTVLKIKTLEYGFINDRIESPLSQNLLKCHGNDKILLLRFPERRIHSQKTVALTLLTYREIDSTIWHRIVTSKRLNKISGLNWNRMKKKTNFKETMLERMKIRAKPDYFSRKQKTARPESLFGITNGIGIEGFAGLVDAQPIGWGGVLPEEVLPGMGFP